MQLTVLPPARRSAAPKSTATFNPNPSREDIAQIRKDFWDKYGARSLLSWNNPKTVKGRKYGFHTGILYLAPGRMSGYEVCPSRSAGCTAGCLHTAGTGFQLPGKTKARIARTRFWFEDSGNFKTLLVHEIKAFVRSARKARLKPVIRLNGTSDIAWEVKFPELFPILKKLKTQPYDYTKVARRMQPGWKLPENYDLTFSRHESNEEEAIKVLSAGGRVAVVFGNCGITRFPKLLPETWHGWPVIDGDLHDLRFIEPASTVVGLRAKGDAVGDDSGFVVDGFGDPSVSR